MAYASRWMAIGMSLMLETSILSAVGCSCEHTEKKRERQAMSTVRASV